MWCSGRTRTRSTLARSRIFASSARSSAERRCTPRDTARASHGGRNAHTAEPVMRKVRNQQESTTSDGTPRAVQIRPARDSDTASACDAVNAIAAEKWYLATVDGFSLEQ